MQIPAQMAQQLAYLGNILTPAGDVIDARDKFRGMYPALGTEGARTPYSGGGRGLQTEAPEAVDPRAQTIAKMQAWDREFRGKWEPWGEQNGLNPEATQNAVRDIHVEFMRKGLGKPTDDQIKYLLSLAQQKGVLR